MRVLIDGEAVNIEELGGEESKASILEAAKKLTASRGLVITKMSVDGAEVEEEAFLAIAGGLDVRFNTQPIRELVADSLAEGEKYFELLGPGLEAVAQMLEAKKTSEALSRFAQAIEGISWLVSVFNNSCMLLGVQFGSLKSGDFQADSEELIRHIDGLGRAMTEGKYLEMAYRIREEVLPAIQRFSKYWNEISLLASSTVQ